jgi:hypothetical protein
MMGDVNIGEIVTRPPFSTLFRIGADTYQEVVSDMQARGYNAENPVVLWRDAAGAARVGMVPNAGQ